MNFLISYHRRSGKVSVQEIEDPREATAAVLKLELAETNPNIEHVVISADSLDDVKRTHSRYFMHQRHQDAA